MLMIPGMLLLFLRVTMFFRNAVMSDSLVTVLLTAVFVHLICCCQVRQSKALFALFRMLLPGQYFILKPFGLGNFKLP